MRTYFAAGMPDLLRLQAGEATSLPGFAPASDDELDEFDTLTQAAEHGDVVIAADVDGPDALVTLERIASFNLDADGTGDLAWYAPQELDQVIALLQQRSG